MDAEFPCIAEGFNDFGLTGERVVVAVFDVAVIEFDLSVTAIFYAIGRVHIDRLDLSRHAFALEQACHD